MPRSPCDQAAHQPHQVQGRAIHLWGSCFFPCVYVLYPGADPPIWQPMAAAAPVSHPFMHVSQPQQSALAINTWERRQSGWLYLLVPNILTINSDCWADITMLVAYYLAYNYLLEVSADCTSEPCVSGLCSRSSLAEKHAVVKQCAQLCRFQWEDNKWKLTNSNCYVNCDVMWSN
jgi:hypothetical protein